MIPRGLCCWATACLIACEAEPAAPQHMSSPCDPFVDVTPNVTDTSAFSIVVIPDTQFYSERYPEIFQSQIAWIADHKSDRSIAFALHEGDIVNHNVAEEWNVVSRAVSRSGLLQRTLSARHAR
jgi:hypothetical protein